MKKAVIFDLDGTLANTLACLADCSNEALKVCDLGPIAMEHFKTFVGNGATTQIKRCLRFVGDEKLEHFDRVFAAYMEIFSKHCADGVVPYEGILELLEQLRGQGIKTAVFSNKPHAQTVDVIDTVFGKDSFDVVLGQTPGIAKKPSPEGVFWILEKLRLAADEVLYVGDTDTDMQTGKGAGAFTVGVLWGFRERQELEENHADAIIEKPAELLDYL